MSEGSEQLQRYYGHNQALEQYVKERGKTELLQRIQPPAVNFGILRSQKVAPTEQLCRSH